MVHAIDTTIQGLLREQERLDELRPIAAQRFGPRLCDLAYANPYDGTPEAVLQAIHSALDSNRQLTFQYTPYGGATLTRRVVAQDLSRISGLPYQWRDVVLTPGAMAALNIVFRALCRPGDQNEVIVMTPCWLDYPVYLENLGIRGRFVPLNEETLRLDLDAIRAALNPHTRAIIFSQPANPSGIIYDASELQALGQLLDTHAPDVMVLSDEAHRDFVPQGTAIPLPAQYYANSCVLYSFGKRFLMQGQRTGYIAVSPRMPQREAFAKQLTQLCRVTGFCTPTALMQLAIRELIDLDIDYSPILARRRRLIDALRSGGYEVPDTPATFFVYPKTPMEDDFAFISRLAEAGVLAIPATVFHSTGRFRLSATANEAQLEEAARVMNRVLSELS
jgi:aspartate aminotransferase